MVWTLDDNGLVIFDWFVLSTRMQVILDSLARPGSAPIWGVGGGKKGEFRDWTTFKSVFHCSKFIGNLSLEVLMFHLFAYLAIIIFLSISSLFKITLLHVSGKFYSSNRLLSGMPEAKNCKILLHVTDVCLPRCRYSRKIAEGNSL